MKLSRFPQIFTFLIATTLISLEMQHAVEARNLLFTRSAASPQRIPLFGVNNNPTSLLSPNKRLQHVSFRTQSLLHRLRAGEQDVEEDDDEEEDNDTNESDDDEDEPANKSDEARLSTPIPVSIKTKYGSNGNTMLDQSIELTLQRRRTIGIVKDNLRRMLPGKPPKSLIQVLHEGRIVSDDVSLDELFEDDEEEDDDEDEDDEDETKGTIYLTIDIIPPVDGKFAQTLAAQLNDVNTAELLRLYAVNEAALYETTVATIQKSVILDNVSEGKEDEGEEEDDDLQSESAAPTAPELVGPKLQERADLIEEQLRDMIQKQQREKATAILEETRPPSAIQAATEIRGERVIDAVPSRGVKTSLRRKLQHTFNVQSWSDTIRYICLFIFFGLFGGRTPMSRLILLLGAPSVLFLQARPVKLFWKQALYTIINNPPGIFLSLLPAPQQALFSLDSDKAMQTIYSEFTHETKQMLEAAESKLNALKRSSEVSDDDEEEEFFDAQEELDDEDNSEDDEYSDDEGDSDED